MGLCSVELHYGIVLETISLPSLAMTTLHRKLDFLNTEYCSRVNQRHFGGKT